MSREELFGYFLVLLAVIFWSGLGVIGKELYRLGADPLTVVAFRVLFALGLLLGTLGSVKPSLIRVRSRDLPLLALYGLVAVALNFSCYFYALKYITVTTAIVLVYTYPAIVVILSRFMFGELLDRRKLLALGLTLAGVFFVAQGYIVEQFKLNLKGASLALVTACGIAFYNLMGKRLLRGIDSWTITFYGFLFGGLVLVGWWSGEAPGGLNYPLLVWVLISVLALFPSILAYGLYLKALNHLEASRASIVATLEPVLASLLAFVVLHEPVEPLQALGGALVLAGVLILRA